MQDRNVCSYLVLRNVRRPTSPDYLPNPLVTLDRNGNADSNRSGGKTFLGQIVPGNFGGKADILNSIGVRQHVSGPTHCQICLNSSAYPTAQKN